MSKNLKYYSVLAAGGLAALVWLGLSCSAPLQETTLAPAAAPPAPILEPKDKPEVIDLVKLAKSGTEQDLMLTYINASPLAYAFTAEDIIYLKEAGVPPQVIAAAIDHGKAAAATVRQPAVAAPAQEPKDKKGVADLVKLAQSGTEENVLLSYIDASPTAFAFTVDDIIYLKGAGVSATAITAAINHGKAIRDQIAKNAPPPEKADAAYYYNSLAPYGTWVRIDGDWYWQPTDLSSFYYSLAPYGTWVVISSRWYWQPFVFRPHYRPMYHHRRWRH
jgi:hypothetical protein